MTGRNDTSRRTPDPAAVLALTVLAVFALLFTMDSYRSARAWPFGAPAHDDGTYRSVMQPRIPPDSAIELALELRDAPGVGPLEHVTFPEDLDLLREPLVYGNGTRSISPTGIRLVEDLLGGKIERADYDPVLGADAYARLLASGAVREAPGATLMTTDSAARSLRVYTDPARTIYIVLPEGVAP